MQIRPSIKLKVPIENLKNHLKPVATIIKVNPDLLSCSFENYRVVIFKYGRVIIHGTNDSSKARTIYN